MDETTKNINFTDPFASPPEFSGAADKDSLMGFKGDLEFSEILDGFTEAKPLPVSFDLRNVGLIVAALLLVVGVYFGYQYGMPYLASPVKEDVAIKEVRPRQAKPVQSTDSVTQVEEAVSDTGDSFGFVTTLGKPDYTKNRKISALEEKLWLSELAHPYTFRRFKSVYEARRALLAGSDSFFIQGLEQNKFWTRMQAVFALADMGANISAEHVQRAIGDARPYLLKNYFKRFKKNSTEGERYVMSLAMFFVDPQAQSVIADILSPYQTGIN